MLESMIDAAEELESMKAEELESMKPEEARAILGNRTTWELRPMRRALTFLGAFNTPEEAKRLEAVKILLSKRGKVKW